MSTKPVNVEDYRILAQRRLPKIIFDYLEGGADDETGLKHNHEVFERYRLMPRRLVDVSKRDLGIELFGRHQSAPFIIGPTGLNGALWPKGDILLARAAATAGIPFVLSTASNASIEDVAAASKGDLWFQLYIVQRKLAEQMVRRADERIDASDRAATIGWNGSARTADKRDAAHRFAVVAGSRREAERRPRIKRMMHHEHSRPRDPGDSSLAGGRTAAACHGRAYAFAYTLLTLRSLAQFVPRHRS
jgi:isopentenyl diphosphate isomerase/L-lactate dehydrogenase-like FMN-dependent dehydrogenase